MSISKLSTVAFASTTCNAIKRLTYLIVPLFLLFLSPIPSAQAQCPTIFLDDMNGIPGYPQVNDLSVCGVQDTLTYYVSNTSGTTLLNSEFILNIPPGLQYSGFATAFDPNYSIMEGDCLLYTSPSPRD